MSHDTPRRLIRNASRAAARGFALLAISLTASQVHAQPAPPPDAPPRQDAQQRPEGQQRPVVQMFQEYGQLLRSLNLDADQAGQVRDIVRKTRAALQGLAQDGQTMSGQDRLAAFRDAMDTFTGDVSAILTDEQKKTFEAGSAKIRENAAQMLRQQAGAGGDRPATRPADDGQAQPGPGQAGPIPPRQLADRIERALAAAEVTDEQKEKLQAAIHDLMQKIQVLQAESPNNDRQTTREKRRAIMNEFRDHAQQILSPEQMEKLHAVLMPGGGQRGPGGPGGARPGPNGGGDNGQGGDGGNMRGEPPPPPPPPGEKPAAAGPQGAPQAHTPEAGTAGLAVSSGRTPTTRPIAVGESMPAFSLNKVEGRTVTRQSLANKPAVIIFGSYTAATFRDHAPLLQQLAKRYGSRVNFLIVYTREMHPIGADEPERNLDEHVEVAPHATLADRAAAARIARDKLELTIDIAPDTMDDALTNRLDGFPNAALLFDANGTLVARQKWAEPFALERAIERELKRKG